MNYSGSEFLAKIKPFRAVPMDVEVELCRTTMTVRQLLALTEGSMIGTGKRRNLDLTIRVGGVAVAKGDLTKQADKQAIRVTAFCRKERE